MGPLFGLQSAEMSPRPPDRRNTLADGHPIRTYPTFPQFIFELSRNTLADGHPIRTPTADYTMQHSTSRNTLADGHPIRTLLRARRS